MVVTRLQDLGSLEDSGVRKKLRKPCEGMRRSTRHFYQTLEDGVGELWEKGGIRSNLKIGGCNHKDHWTSLCSWVPTRGWQEWGRPAGGLYVRTLSESHAGSAREFGGEAQREKRGGPA